MEALDQVSWSAVKISVVTLQDYFSSTKEEDGKLTFQLLKQPIVNSHLVDIQVGNLSIEKKPLHTDD